MGRNGRCQSRVLDRLPGLTPRRVGQRSRRPCGGREPIAFHTSSSPAERRSQRPVNTSSVRAAGDAATRNGERRVGGPADAAAERRAGGGEERGKGGPAHVPRAENEQLCLAAGPPRPLEPLRLFLSETLHHRWLGSISGKPAEREGEELARFGARAEAEQRPHGEVVARLSSASGQPQISEPDTA
ncbi:hypothetical protein SKAU_G00198180 [Synaphobranchus kaupii]|uniref:Uncharacterized protein n=1 Tax=Synaphobranchus kaupii TaxID=118154 RepID=A0A9Q1IX14_SYNKA|nr:hypothetical protein SKAU_G00198180 [Synaphobranchus kaupii]